jgi:rubrerythrin
MAMNQTTATQSAPVSTEKMKVYVCSMDQYTSEKPGNCPMCGMKMQEKEMTAADAQAALDKSKDMIKKRS